MVAIALAIGLLASPASAVPPIVGLGGHWIPAPTVSAPAARWGASFAYFAGAFPPVGTYDVSFLFGGCLGTNPCPAGDGTNQTWAWDDYDEEWTQLFPAHSPSPRIGASMGQDCWGTSPTCGLVLFGGYNPNTNTLLSDTWTFDGNDWTQESPTTIPSARAWAGSVSSSSAGMTVFGGCTGLSGASCSTLSNETWFWNGATWDLCSCPSKPSARMAWGQMAEGPDPWIRPIVLFGGYDGSTFSNETWTWGVNGWEGWGPAPGFTSPPGRASGGMVDIHYAPPGGTAEPVTLLFGGGNGGGYRSDTWRLHWGPGTIGLQPTGWTEQLCGVTQCPSPSARQAFGLVKGSSGLTLFGGLPGINPSGETWRYL